MSEFLNSAQNRQKMFELHCGNEIRAISYRFSACELLKIIADSRRLTAKYF